MRQFRDSFNYFPIPKKMLSFTLYFFVIDKFIFFIATIRMKTNEVKPIDERIRSSIIDLFAIK